MNVSGIVVLVKPAQLKPCLLALRGLPGVEVHGQDPARGRVVVTQEAETVGAEVEGLQRIKALPQVMAAELVYHYFGDDAEPVTEIPAALQDQDGLDPALVPAYLRD